MKISPLFYKDAYKADHRRQYPDGTEEVYSNITARKSRNPRLTRACSWGFQATVQKFLIDEFQENFFSVPKAEAVSEYRELMDAYLGKDAIPVDHIAALHRLGYLPLHIKALPEGTMAPIGVPLFTIKNTHNDFFWLTNDLETLISCETWKGITNVPIALEYRRMLQQAAAETNPEMLGFVPWQGHDFSMRGMDGVDSAMRSGAAHLLAFTGTDTTPSLKWIKKYYGTDYMKELVGGSVYATEHSVMCMGGAENELDTIKRLIVKRYPKGIVSIVSDTWDYWDTITSKAAAVKDIIMARDGKVVFRPDSGDPVKIVCGDPEASAGSPEYKGSIQVLWDLFGGTTTSTGFKQLDPHVGLIYGDSITMEICADIIAGLKAKGFASTNVVLGIGSYTYQYNTRDTLGLAIKATHGRIEGVPVDIYKNPKTDSGFKKSAKGLLRVNADLTLTQQVSESDEEHGMLQTIFLDGKAYNKQTFTQVRERLLTYL